MGRDAGSPEGEEGSTEPRDMPSLCQDKWGTQAGWSEGSAGVSPPGPNSPCFAGTLVQIPITHLFLHDPGQVTSLRSLSFRSLIWQKCV